MTLPTQKLPFCARLGREFDVIFMQICCMVVGTVETARP
jgi:hypothetical protein